MAKRVTTLFIRDTSVNLLMMRGREVEKWVSLPLEPGLVNQGLIVDEAQVADRVKQIFKESGAKTSKVITALSGHDSLYRIITLPELPEAILPEAIKREARRTIPTPLEEVYFSYQRLPSPTKGEIRIFLVTYPRNIVDTLMRTLQKAGVSPYVLDLAPLALCRIPNEPRAIIINARLDHLDVMVIADRIPQVVRRLSLPGETELLQERLPLIAEEFKRTVTFYNSGHLDKSLDASVPVYVCGDLADKPETWLSVVGGAGYTVSVLSPPLETPEGMNANEFLVNIGLALRELLTEKEEANFSIVNLNALPEAYVPPGFSIARVLIPVGIVIGIGLIVFGVIFVQYNRAETTTLRDKLASVQQSVAQKQGQIAVLARQVKSLEAIASELDARILSMEQGRASIYLDLREIVTLAKDKVTLEALTHGDGSVSVNGRASNLGHLYKYARELRQSPRFSTIWVSSVTGSSSEGFSFTLSLTK